MSSLTPYLNLSPTKTSAFHTSRSFVSVPFVTVSFVRLSFLIPTQVYELSPVGIRSLFVRSPILSTTPQNTVIDKKHDVNPVNSITSLLVLYHDVYCVNHNTS